MNADLRGFPLICMCTPEYGGLGAFLDCMQDLMRWSVGDPVTVYSGLRQPNGVETRKTRRVYEWSLGHQEYIPGKIAGQFRNR
jgi:hypothetical protein